MKSSTTDDGESPADRGPAKSHGAALPLRVRWMVCGGDVIAWVLAVTLAVIVLLRVLWFDKSYVLVWINSFTQYIYLPIYVCLGWAIWRLNRNLVCLCTVIAACHIALVYSDFFPAGLRTGDAHSPARIDTFLGTSKPFRLFYANVNFQNREFDTMYDEALRADPDIIVFVEFTLGWRSTIKDSPLNKHYSYWGTQHRRGGQGVAIWSRLPLIEIEHLPGQPPRTLAVDVVIGHETTRLFILHSPRPIAAAWADYFDYWDTVYQVIEKQPDPMIVVGDFNSTQYSRVFGELTHNRFRGAHEDCGRGLATTWPNDGFSLPPIRIDHLLITPQLECLRIYEGRGHGSDHRPIIADLRLSTP